MPITGTSPASASTAALGNPVKVSYYEHIRVVAVLQGATGGTLDVYLQATWDNTKWYDIAHFPQITAAAAQTIRTLSMSRAAVNTTLTAIGQDLTPALAAGTYLSGDFGVSVRAVCVAGAGTSDGATQTIHILGDYARAR